jgi:MoaA/NifB/PqqE/SkfB family radical SAM enzyme
MHEDYVEGTLTCLTDKVIKEKINTDFPLVLNIEPTNACNLSCCFCPREKTAKKNGTHYLPLETYVKIIDEASAYPQLTMLNLHKDGEPLMHNQLAEMIEYAKKRKVAKTIHLNTNGTLSNTKNGMRLLDSGIDDVTISVDAAFSDTYKKMKGVDGLESLKKSITSFINYRDKIGTHTTIRVKIMEFDMVSDAEISAFHKEWAGLADHVQVTGVHNWSGAIQGLDVTDETSPLRYPCALLWYTLAVNSNGIVSICNVDWDYSGAVGNIYKNNLHEIWNGDPLRKIRRSHLNSQWDSVSVCNLCVVWASLGNLREYFSSHKEFLSNESE